MVSRKGRGRGGQTGMRLPEGITSSSPSTLWKMMKIIKDEGATNKTIMMDRMKKRWRHYPSPVALATVLARRTDVFVLINKKELIYDLKEEVKNAMD